MKNSFFSSSALYRSSAWLAIAITVTACGGGTEASNAATGAGTPAAVATSSDAVPATGAAAGTAASSAPASSATTDVAATDASTSATPATSTAPATTDTAATTAATPAAPATADTATIVTTPATPATPAVVTVPTVVTATSPSTVYSVGTEIVSYSRTTADGTVRPLPTKIWYPAVTPGERTAFASGKFPLIVFSHGQGGTYNSYSEPVSHMVAAGFIVATPEFVNSREGAAIVYEDGWQGVQSLDVTQVITDVLARNLTAGDTFFGHIDPKPGVGVAGHSFGGITTDALLGLKRDSRISTAIIYAGGNVAPFTGSPVKVMFVHGDDDPYESLNYASLRAAYAAVPAAWPKAFLTEIKGGHWEYMYPWSPTYAQTWMTSVDWFRYGLYGDLTALNRLSGEAYHPEGKTSWEFDNSSGIRVEAEDYVQMSGVQIEATGDGGRAVSYLDANDSMVWDVTIPAAGIYTVQYRVASPEGKGIMQIEKAGGSVIFGTIKTPKTGGWQTYTTITHQVTLPAGPLRLSINVREAGFNLDWFKLTQVK